MGSPLVPFRGIDARARVHAVAGGGLVSVFSLWTAIKSDISQLGTRLIAWVLQCMKVYNSACVVSYYVPLQVNFELVLGAGRGKSFLKLLGAGSILQSLLVLSFHWRKPVSVVRGILSEAFPEAGGRVFVMEPRLDASCLVQIPEVPPESSRKARIGSA